MLCSNPTVVGSQCHPCGGCEPCRINRKRIWTNRLLLENGEHGNSCFLTLTYSDATLRLSMNGLPTLAPEDARNWLKRIRKAVSPAKLRYYLVGEYGSQTWRPHYHVALFGFPSCSHGQTFRSRNRAMADRCCASCRLVHSTWGKGDIDNGRLEEGSARYLVSYVLKKMTRYDDPRLGGRMPEFARMSLKPGIGQTAVHDIADAVLRYGLDSSLPDVPSAIRRGSTIAPLGRYLTQQLRLMCGKEINCPDEVLREAAIKLLPLRQAARLSSVLPSFKGQIVEAFRQEVMNRLAKHHVYKQRSSL